MSDDEVIEPEAEAIEETSDAPSGVPPAKGTNARSSSGGGGERRPKKAAGEHGLIARIAQFLRDTRAEMRRVSWPNATLVKNSTIITLIAVIFFAAYLFAVDRMWSFLIGHLKTLMGGA